MTNPTPAPDDGQREVARQCCPDEHRRDEYCSVCELIAAALAAQRREVLTEVIEIVHDYSHNAPSQITNDISAAIERMRDGEKG